MFRWIRGKIKLQNEKNYQHISGINYPYIVEYLQNLLPEENAFLTELEKYADLNKVPIIEKEVRCMLKTYLEFLKPKTIVEVGTAIGYSAIFFAQYVGDGGKVISLEKDEKLCTIAQENIKKAGLENKITVICGDAIETIKTINEPIDLVFLDANKSKYRHYFDVTYPYLNAGGMFICDNILYKGMVSNDELLPRKHRAIVRALRDFLHFISHHENLTTSIIPISDGVSVSVKLK